MQESVKQYATEVQRTHGVSIQIRVGLNAGEVVVRSIGSDLHMDYTAVGQTTHLAVRMEQMARPGSIVITAEVLRLGGDVQVDPPRTGADYVLVLRYSCCLRHDHAQGGRADSVSQRRPQDDDLAVNGDAQSSMRAPCVDRHLWRGQGIKIRGRLPFPEEQVTEEA
jgi:class 3 adenylate cyclase